MSMRRTKAGREDGPSGPATVIHTLVISDHEAVRRQLVIYFSHSPALAASGDAFSPAAIFHAEPDVVVLDLSRLDHADVEAAIDATQKIGARLIALASVREPTDERAITRAGGLYRLKSAGADGLADIVREVARRPSVNGAGRNSA